MVPFDCLIYKILCLLVSFTVKVRMPVFTVVDFLPGLEGFRLPFRDRAHILREIRTPLMPMPQLIDEETEFLACLVFHTFW